MQSWGTQSRFHVRDTGLEPSKSGVIGLLCAALGKPRQEKPEHVERWPSLELLAALRMGVRVDRPGVVRRDYHTAGGTRWDDGYGVAKADGSAPGTVVSQRFYLADASFLAGLESADEGLLHTLHEALASPVWPLYLGRKSFVPSVPVCLRDGIRQEGLMKALSSLPFSGDGSEQSPIRVRVVADAGFGTGAEVRQDVPLDFAARRFTIRHVEVGEIELEAGEGR